MAKEKITYRCSDCGWTSPKWVGQCRECGAWGTVDQAGEVTGGQRAAASPPRRPALPIGDVDGERATSRSTGVGELDRVLGGGIVPGAVILLAGEPGVGKSTLLLDVAAKAARTAASSGRGPVLYVTGEESAAQVRGRAERIGALEPNLLIADETELGIVLGHVEASAPSLLIVDSVQTISSDGGIAGPRVLEHLVDVVCQFEGDRHSRLRLLRAVKNRYGPTDEVGCFELTDSGIYGLADPSGLFLSRTTRGVPGTCVAVSLEGRRPLPTEIQSLVAPSSGGSPRRTTSGVDHARVAMILAVLQARIGADTSGADVYVSTVGGARTVEPAIDLAMAISIVSSLKGVPPRADLVAVGEISLTGEVRACTGTQRRLAEAARLGFAAAIVPAQGSEDLARVDGITVFTVSDLATAIRVAFPTDSQ